MGCWLLFPRSQVYIIYIMIYIYIYVYIYIYSKRMVFHEFLEEHVIYIQECVCVCNISFNIQFEPFHGKDRNILLRQWTISLN